jgi:hypothetical protein
MKYLRRNLFFLFTFYVLRFTCYVTPAYAQKDWSGRCVQGDVATIQGLECLFGNILQVIVGFAGLAFFVMFITGGFQYMTSSGDDKKIAASSSTLTMAVIGLVGIIVSWLIIKFISTFTGVDILNFVIPGP